MWAVDVHRERVCVCVCVCVCVDVHCVCGLVTRPGVRVAAAEDYDTVADMITGPLIHMFPNVPRRGCAESTTVNLPRVTSTLLPGNGRKVA